MPKSPQLIAASMLVAVSAGALAAKPVPPSLSITIDDGRRDAGAGDHAYTITLRNHGQRAVRDLRLSQTLPAGTKPVSISNDGRARGAEAHWKLDLPPGAERSVRLVTHFGPPPSDQLRVAATACARQAPDDRPLVCATDTNITPTGVAQEQAPLSGPPPRWAWLTALAGGLACAAFFLTRRLARLASTGGRYGRRRRR